MKKNLRLLFTFRITSAVSKTLKEKRIVKD